MFFRLMELFLRRVGWLFCSSCVRSFDIPRSLKLSPICMDRMMGNILTVNKSFETSSVFGLLLIQQQNIHSYKQRYLIKTSSCLLNLIHKPNMYKTVIIFANGKEKTIYSFILIIKAYPTFPSL
jgi:hypothetical protein